MADIAKCEGTDCPLKKTCFRFRAESNPYAQSYFTSIPYNVEEKKCEYYWEMNGTEGLKQLDEWHKG